MSPSVGAQEKKLVQLCSYAMRGRFLNEVLGTYTKEREIRMAKITGTGDTLLHVAVLSGKERLVANMVNLLVREENEHQAHQNNVVVTVADGDDEQRYNMKSILGAENERKNTPLHLAAIMGNVKMCRIIGERDPSLIARRNIDGETPLFLAAFQGKEQAFIWLHHLHMEYLGVPSVNFPSVNFDHCERDNKDTILHCAIAQGHMGVAIKIIHLYKDHLKEMMKRNKKGLSPLHLLATQRFCFRSSELRQLYWFTNRIDWLLKVKEEKNQAITIEELLRKTPKKIIVIKIIKNICLMLLLLLQIPLYPFLRGDWINQIRRKQIHTWSLQILKELLQHASDEEMSKIIERTTSDQPSDEDMSQIIVRTASDQPSSSRQRERDNGSESGTITIVTPLMIAVKNGVVEMVGQILALFPSTIKVVNTEGKNILLLAVEYRQTYVLQFLCRHKWLAESLFGQVDNDGNNALHLAARLAVDPDWLHFGEELPMGREVKWFEFVKGVMPSSLLEQYNKKMETPDEIFKESHKELLKSERKSVGKTCQAYSVVSTIVLSVAFASRTSVPGGYDQKGYAILRNSSPMFKTFVRSSFGALFFSLLSTICFLHIVTLSHRAAPSWRFVPTQFFFGMYLMFISIICLWISFCAGDFFMLDDDNQKLHKAMPRYIVWASVVIIIVVSALPGFIGPALSSNPRIPYPPRKMTRPIQYQRIHQE